MAARGVGNADNEPGRERTLAALQYVAQALAHGVIQRLLFSGSPGQRALATLKALAPVGILMQLEHGVGGFAYGLALFLFPGATWAFALGRGLDLPKRIALSVVLSFTLAPMAMFVLNLIFGVPIRLSTIAFLSSALGMVGLAVLVAPLLRLRLGTR